MEAIALASHRNLAPDHPVFKLLAHHFLYIMAINQYVHKLNTRCSKYPVLFNYPVIEHMYKEIFFADPHSNGLLTEVVCWIRLVLWVAPALLKLCEGGKRLSIQFIHTLSMT